jgi:hypothetical protein
MSGSEKKIVKIWITGKSSATLIIPKDLAKEYGLDEPSYAILEKKSDGILIKKLIMN